MAKTPSKTSGRLTRILLVASLGVNLVIAGWAVGNFASGGRGAPPARFDLNLGPFARGLTTQQSREIGMILRENRSIRPPSRASRAAQAQHFLEAVRQDPFDPVAVQNVFASQRAHSEQVLDTVQMAFIQQLEKMTPQERAAYAQRLEFEIDRMSRGPNRGPNRELGPRHGGGPGGGQGGGHGDRDGNGG